METLAIQLADYYKFAHAGQYDESINKLVSYFTPRSCRLPDKEYVVNFGVQAFCKEYLIEKFNNEFFNIPYNDVKIQVFSFLTNTLPGIDVNEEVDRIMSLHKLGYLPISIRTLPEGSKVRMGCPNVELVTTHPEFSWIGGFIESLMSSYLWKPMIDATVGHWYREVVNRFYESTVDNWRLKAKSAMSEFGFRGADTPDSGIHSGTAWLLSFDKTATCAAIPFINKYYNMRFPGGVYPIDDYINDYHKYLLENQDEPWAERKLHDELNSFMEDNIDWHSMTTLDKTGRKRITALPLGYDDYPNWLIPDEVWNKYKEFSYNERLLVRTGKWAYDLVDFNEEIVGKGLISTEHSVMCSSIQLYMNKELNQEESEKELVKKLLTKVYPNSSFSMVSDSYDYWRLVTSILPELKDEVMSHEGTLFVRGDSGDPVKIVAGYIDITDKITSDEIDELLAGKASILNSISDISDIMNDLPIDNLHINEFVYDYCYIRSKDGKLYRLDYDDFISEFSLGKELPKHEAYGTVSMLAEIFGTTLNSKGYSVLDPHIRVIYGDSITQKRAEMIYSFLKYKGFSSENVSLGAGSFSFHAYEGYNGNLYPYTRDTFGCAMKVTYGECKDGTNLMIYKDPKTNNNSDVVKKSMKGCCSVYEKDGYYYLDHDGLTLSERELDSKNELIEVFINGYMTKEITFSQIRNTLNEGNF